MVFELVDFFFFLSSYSEIHITGSIRKIPDFSMNNVPWNFVVYLQLFNIAYFMMITCD